MIVFSEVSISLESIVGTIEKKAREAGRNPAEISLVVVTKGQPMAVIESLYQMGIRDFGENRVQEALEKMEKSPKDIRWHFIGKLQKKKVSKVIGHFTLIHSVDTPGLAEKLSSASVERGVISSVLLEANTSGEAAKSGLLPDEWKQEYTRLLDLAGIKISGLMTMAPLTDDEGVIRNCFSKLRHLRDELQEIGGELSTLSMGMSQDYPIAIEEGATLLRIGSAIYKS
ncbi:MAG: hypothetical protein K1000chlam4_00545 [Chlamydiae bacterium]|nr:hypothetical protein [Chlamydiota bacterium]